MAGNVIDTAGAHDFKYTCTGSVTVGDLLIVGVTPMVALESGVTGQTITCGVGVEAILPKDTSALTAFERVYYAVNSPGDNIITSTADKIAMIGYATEAAATGDDTGVVRLITGPIVKENQT